MQPAVVCLAPLSVVRVPPPVRPPLVIAPAKSAPAIVALRPVTRVLRAIEQRAAVVVMAAGAQGPMAPRQIYLQDAPPAPILGFPILWGQTNAYAPDPEVLFPFLMLRT